MHPIRTICLLLAAVLWLPAAVRAADVNTINSSEGTAPPELFNLFKSAPASCTGINDPTLTDADVQAQIAGIYGQASSTATLACNERGNAAADASANGTFFSSGWSDLLNNAQGVTLADFEAAGESITTGGQAFMPIACFGPECGHMLKGDVKEWDFNNDGVMDASLNEQFSWGITSYIPKDRMNSLAVGSGGVAGLPPGATRMAVRQALGRISYVTAASYNAVTGDTATCNGKIVAGPPSGDACRDGKIDSASTTNDPDISNVTDIDPDVFGRCDPDYFHPDTPLAAFVAAGRNPPNPPITTLAEGQKALWNCLMHIAATPLTGPQIVDDVGTVHSPLEWGLDLVGYTNPAGFAFTTESYTHSGFTPEINARDQWVDQAVIGWIQDQRWAGAEVGSPSWQDYSQRLYAAAGFRDAPDMMTARYVNDTQVSQMDRDWDPNNNVVPQNNAVPYGADTYSYAFRYAVSTASPHRANMGGRTNNTLDPFWGGATFDAVTGEYDYTPDLGLINGTTAVPGNDCDPNVGAVPELGIGCTNDLSVLVAQDVEGYLFSCLNCDTPELVASGDSNWWQSYFDANQNNTPIELVDLPTFQPFPVAWQTVPTITHAP